MDESFESTTGPRIPRLCQLYVHFKFPHLTSDIDSRASRYLSKTRRNCLPVSDRIESVGTNARGCY